VTHIQPVAAPAGGPIARVAGVLLIQISSSALARSNPALARLDLGAFASRKRAHSRAATPPAIATMLRSCPVAAAADRSGNLLRQGIWDQDRQRRLFLHSVSQPARWPITSTTMMRWWLWAVPETINRFVAIRKGVEDEAGVVNATSLSMVLAA
jgi:hypothetical protein